MVTQAEAPSSSPPRPGTRNSLTTAAAIRRGAIKISNPIPFPEEDGVRAPASVPGAPAAQIAPSADVTGEKAITLADIRPPQSSQFNGSYDGRPPTRARRVVPNANGGVTTEAQSGDSPSQHSRAGKSVEVLPTQPPLNPRHQQNRSSLRNPRNSGVMSGTSQRGSSYEASGDDDSKESSGKKRSSGTLRNVLRKMFGSKREKDDRRAPSRKGSKTREIGDWMMDVRYPILGYVH